MLVVVLGLLAGVGTLLGLHSASVTISRVTISWWEIALGAALLLCGIACLLPDKSSATRSRSTDVVVGLMFLAAFGGLSAAVVSHGPSAGHHGAIVGSTPSGPPQVASAQAETTSTTSTHTPAPMSHKHYENVLASAGRSVRGALAALASARSQNQLTARLHRAHSLLSNASARLDRLIPPPAVAGINAHLVSGLSKLAGAASNAAGAVDGGAICAAPSALAGISGSAGAREMRSAVGRLPARGYSASALAPAAREMPNRRLANGTLLFSIGGSSTLTVRNGTSSDGVVKLHGGGTVLALYVRSHDAATAGGIPDGTFQVYFATGSDWDSTLNTFTRRCDFQQFDQTLQFASSAGSYTGATITLNPVPQGNASTSGISPDQFPR